MTGPGPEHVKVHFRLEVEDDWPPAGVESLWAVDRGDGRVELANTPFFVRGVANGDVVETSVDDEVAAGQAEWSGPRTAAPSA
ncbi:DUF4265 domain-containing protein [Streptomyces sp. NPDC005722]